MSPALPGEGRRTKHERVLTRQQPAAVIAWVKQQLHYTFERFVVDKMHYVPGDVA